MKSVNLRTGVWYDDREITLNFPDDWDVVTYFPQTPSPLTDEQIAAAFANPVNQSPLRVLAAGKKTPVIIVDDLSRPTPVYRLIPFLLKEFEQAGIPSVDVHIVVATGTHGRQDMTALKNKLGQETFIKCRVSVHSDFGKTRLIGKTSHGTPIHLNREIYDADFVVGVSGVYPQYTTGFGGGSKLALGVLGRKSISHLHFGHGSREGQYDINNDFRRDLTEISRMIGLDSICTVHSNADVKVIKVTCGDHYSYYPSVAEFSLQRFNAPPPDDADVVIANGYPSDISYTFMRKGNRPILCAPKSATKIMIGSNPEGVGHHGLYPQGKSDRYLEVKAILDRIKIMPPGIILRKVIKNLPFIKKRTSMPPVSSAKTDYTEENNDALRFILYSPSGVSAGMQKLKEVDIYENWDEILSLISREQSNVDRIRVRIYPCAPLQCIETL